MIVSKRLLGPFLVVTAAIVASVVITFMAGLNVIRTRERIQRIINSIQEVDDFMAIMTLAETGQRGYLLTGEAQYLEPYRQAVPVLPQQMQTLRAHGVDAAMGRKLEELASAKLNELQKTIDLHDREGVAAAVAVVRTDAGRNLMEQLRAVANSIQKQERAVLEKTEAAADRATLLRTLVFLGAGLFNLVFVWWAYGVIRKHNERLTGAMDDLRLEREELSRQRNLLDVTLESIGDCVMATDINGMVTFMNAVAATVTGWSVRESIGRPAKEIFRIINEESRQPVESPVEKVLASGKIQGLANHTLLIRKDGTEVPIDDSGAPIQDTDGRLRGVVLVFRDFSEHKKYERELLTARADAEAANKAKDQFLAMVSHELRTPLTPVVATLSRWELTDEAPEGLRQELEIIRRSVDLEIRLIDDLLDLTRIARGILVMNPEVVDAHALIEPIAGMFRSEIDARRLRLEINLGASRRNLCVDASRMQQVIWNMLRNSAKFTDSGGTITIETSSGETGEFSVRVADTGIGMTEQTIARLWTPFEQGEATISRKQGGLGLGLAISKSIIDLMGGTIAAESAGLGKGSAFTVQIPTVDEMPEPGHDRHLVALGETNRQLGILLVEDHSHTSIAMRRLLEARGHRVETAGTVAAAAEQLAASNFDLLLCDLGLPDGSGLDVVRELRARSGTRAIAVSGFGMEHDVSEALAAGFDMHLLKPVNIRQIDAAIARLFADQPAPPGVGSSGQG